MCMNTTFQKRSGNLVWKHGKPYLLKGYQTDTDQTEYGTARRKTQSHAPISPIWLGPPAGIFLICLLERKVISYVSPDIGHCWSVWDRVRRCEKTGMLHFLFKILSYVEDLMDNRRKEHDGSAVWYQYREGIWRLMEKASWQWRRKTIMKIRHVCWMCWR